MYPCVQNCLKSLCDICRLKMYNSTIAILALKRGYAKNSYNVKSHLIANECTCFTIKYIQKMHYASTKNNDVYYLLVTNVT